MSQNDPGHNYHYFVTMNDKILRTSYFYKLLLAACDNVQCIMTTPGHTAKSLMNDTVNGNEILLKDVSDTSETALSRKSFFYMVDSTVPTNLVYAVTSNKSFTNYMCDHAFNLSDKTGKPYKLDEITGMRNVVTLAFHEMYDILVSCLQSIVSNNLVVKLLKDSLKMEVFSNLDIRHELNSFIRKESLKILLRGAKASDDLFIFKLFFNFIHMNRASGKWHSNSNEFAA